MGGYTIENPSLSLKAAGQEFTGTVVNVGNPHFVVFCEDADAVDLDHIGPEIEHHPLFPARINVEFVSRVKDSPDTLRMRVWERGSGITKACGTGASATAAAAVSSGVVASPCRIVMDGGTLDLVCDTGSATLLMRGPARTVFEGYVEV